MDAKVLQESLMNHKDGMTIDLRSFLSWALAHAPEEFPIETNSEFSMEYAQRYGELNDEEKACADLLIDWSLQLA